MSGISSSTKKLSFFYILFFFVFYNFFSKSLVLELLLTVESDIAVLLGLILLDLLRLLDLLGIVVRSASLWRMLSRDLKVLLIFCVLFWSMQALLCVAAVSSREIRTERGGGGCRRSLEGSPLQQKRQQGDGDNSNGIHSESALCRISGLGTFRSQVISYRPLCLIVYQITTREKNQTARVI